MALPSCEADDTRPAILYGALRSGTTLLTLMLDGHPRLACPGESDFLLDHVRRRGTTWELDKKRLSQSRMFLATGIPVPTSDDAEEAVHEMLGALRTRHPGRLVLVLHRHLDLAYRFLGMCDTLHLKRDPRDVARSSVEIGFAGIYEFGADHWLQTEDQWRRTKDLPGIRRLAFRFEDLVAEPVPHLTGICAFLGVPYDDGLFGYLRSTTYAYPDPALREQWKTRVSARQVARLEERLGPALQDAGYAPSGFPRPSSGATGEAILRVRNRAAIWRFMVRRYGIAWPVLRGIGRRAGLPGMEHMAQRRIDREDLKYLK